MTIDNYRCVGNGARGSASGPLRMIFVEGPKSGADMCNRIEVFGRDREEIARILLAAFEPADNGADDDDWEGTACRLSVRLDEAIRERDEAIKERDEAIKERDDAAEKLKQAEAIRLQAVKVLVGVDECCDECRVISENEEQRHR